MRLSRRLIGVLLVLAFAGALAPGALAGKRKPTSPAPPTVPTYVVPGSGAASMVDIDALR